MIYNLVLLPLFIFSILSIITKNVMVNKIIFFSFVVLLVIIASIRFGVGTDFFTYLEIWYAIRPFDEAIIYGTSYDYLEPGFRYLTSLLKLFSDNSFIFFLTYSLISFIFIYLGLEKLKIKYLLVSLFLFYLIFYIPYVFNGMRQAISMSIFILSIHYIYYKKFWKTFFLTLLATSFHISGIFIIIIYFLNRIKLDYKVFLLAGFILSFLFFKFHILEYLFSIILPYKVDTYFELFSEPTSFFQLFTRFALLLFFVFFLKYFKKYSFYYSLVYIYTFGFFLYFSFFDLNMLATRINMFFRILEIVMIPIILYRSKNLFTKISIIIIYLPIGIYSYFVNINNIDNIYKTIF